MKLGRPGTVTAEQARTLTIQTLADVGKGNDPLEDRNSAGNQAEGPFRFEQCHCPVG